MGSRNENRCEVPVVPPSRVVQKGSILPAVTWDNICGVLSTRKALSLGIRVFLGGESPDMESYVAGLSYSVSSSSRFQTNATWPVAPATNHIININYLVSGRIFQGYRGYLPGVSQEPVLSLECTWVEYPKFAVLTLYCTPGLYMEERRKETFEDILRCVTFVKPSRAHVRSPRVPRVENHRKRVTLRIMVTFH